MIFGNQHLDVAFSLLLLMRRVCKKLLTPCHVHATLRAIDHGQNITDLKAVTTAIHLRLMSFSLAPRQMSRGLKFRKPPYFLISRKLFSSNSSNSSSIDTAPSCCRSGWSNTPQLEPRQQPLEDDPMIPLRKKSIYKSTTLALATCPSIFSSLPNVHPSPNRLSVHLSPSKQHECR